MVCKDITRITRNSDLSRLDPSPELSGYGDCDEDRKKPPFKESGKPKPKPSFLFGYVDI
jgi:hypothetical protein